MRQQEKLKMKKVKSIILTIVVIALATMLFLVPGCQQAATTASETTTTAAASETTKAAETTTTAAPAENETSSDFAITVWKFGGTRIERAYGASKTTAWNEANPTMTAEWIENDWSARSEKVVTSLEAGNLPDVIIVDTQSIPDFASMGAIQAISDLDNGLVETWKSKFVPETFELGYFNDKFYGFSTYVDISTFLAYNTEYLRKAELVDENGDATPPKTWDDLLSYCETLQGAGYTPLAMALTNNVNDINMFEGVSYANGGRYIDDEGNIAVNKKGFVDALELYKKLGAYALPGGVESTYRDMAINFFNGQAAMYPALSWVGVWNTELQIPPGFAYDMTTFPLNPNPTGEYEPINGLMAGTFCLMVTSNAKNIDAVLKYIDYWAQDEQLIGWDGSVQFGRVPAGLVCWNTDNIKKFYPALKKDYDDGILFKSVIPNPSFPGLTEIQNLLSVAIQEVMLGVSEPQAALDKVAVEMEAILANQ